MEMPLVSVICLCYNHRQFVREAIVSVLEQSYANIEIIIVDDCSTDNSVEIIHDIVKEAKRPVRFLSLPVNVGNCRAFNQGLILASGKYIIDFATDDVMTHDRIAQQVTFFETLDTSYGIIFSDATYIDQQGKFLRYHYEYLFQKKLLSDVPTGDVFQHVVQTYFICSPTMMIRKAVLDELGGYDENLAYEDFDLWVRASRNYKFDFQPGRLTSVRKSGSSLSTGWYKKKDKQLHSTYLVCIKAQHMLRSEGDRQALLQRARYELRQSVLSENNKEAVLFYQLIKTLGKPSLADISFYNLNALRLPLARVRNLYHWLKFS